MKKKTAPSKPPSRKHIFPIVGFGASAGGLEAFTKVLSHLPENTGMAFVLVQHLDPTHGSMLKELLARSTKMSIAQARNDTRVEPDHIYVIPPNADLTIADGRLRVRARTAVRGQHLPIDHFLRSLAEDRGSMSIGVILSGTASDGTLGLKAIKAEGGITFAQSEKTAKYSGMPSSAIAAGVVDYVLSPEGIARELARVGRHPYVVRDREPVRLGPGDDDDLPKLLFLLRDATGVDFTHYKHNTVRRRIARRMVVRKIERLGEYLAYVREKPAELNALYQDILINVTSFFRDPAAFRALKKTVFPRLLRGRSSQDPLRIWIPGCSTGEEAYSLGIVALECVRESSRNIPIQIFATDVSDASIEKARAGVYPDGVAQDVPPEILRQYFTPVEAGYQVNRSLRDLCVFARQNVVRDAPFSRLDLISCRNVLIYLAPVLQHRAVTVFRYGLKPTGYLLLGNSESISAMPDLFTLVDKKHKIYTSKPGPVRLNLDFPHTEPMPEKPEPVRPHEPGNITEVTGEADRMVLDRFGPAGVVVNEEMKVLQFRGRTGRYLEPQPGEASFHLFKMLREGLMLELRAVLQKARKKNAPVRKEDVEVHHHGESFTVALEVIPFRNGASKERHFLVLFEENVPAFTPAPHAPRVLTKAEESRELRRMKRELDATKQYLQSTIEELEGNNEELKSANEEIQSSNEELQSMNEEMETAKEELQSTNEELTTVNEELENRNIELAQVSNDLSNLIASLQIPVVMVDNGLRLRRFTPAAEKVLNLISTDLGRPLLDIRPNIDMPDLQGVLRNVIDNLQVVEREVQDSAGRSYSLWVRPYRTADNTIDGAVLALVDITALKNSMAQSHDLREDAEAIAATVREPFVALDGELRVIASNAPFYRTFGLAPQGTENIGLFDIGSGDWNIPELRTHLTAALVGENFTQGHEIEHTFRKVGRKFLSINIRRVPASGKPRMILVAIEDITGRRIAEESLRDSQAQFATFAREAPVGLLQSDAKGECFFANAEACRIAGITPDEALGLGWTRKVHADDLALLTATMEAARQNREEFSIEFRFQHGEEILWAHLVSIELRDRDGTTTGFLGAITDISERMRLEEELRHSQKMEAIGRVSGGVAHDFNNMLTVISGYSSQLLAAIPEDHPARHAAEQVRKVGDQASVLTRQLLAFSRKQVMRPSHVNLNEVLRDMHDLLERVLGDSIEVELALDPEVRTIVVDPGQIQQVVLNLAINARDAMTGGGRLTIATGTESVDETSARIDGLHEGDYVTMTIADTGIGMEHETRERMFEPFFTTKPPGAGTGLGLSMVYGIVQQSGGAILVNSEPGAGTTFRIYLPQVSAAFESERPEPQIPIAGGTETILLVEDAAAVRSLVRELLEQRGYTVLEARDGGEALAVSQSYDGRIDLLLTDLLMPRMGGHELAKRIRRHQPRVKVIYMSAYSGDALHAAEKDANFLEKPFKPDGLAAFVRKVLDKQGVGSG